MTQRTDIANIALGMLGEAQITSIDDENSRVATAIKINYNIARDATLEAYEWSFAKQQFKPSLLPDKPLWQYTYQYTIPPVILRVLEVERFPVGSGQPVLHEHGHNSRPRRAVDHEVQGRLILTNYDPIYCTGIARIEQEGLFSNLFVHAFAAKLAMLVCYTVTESNSKFDRVTGLFGGFINEARSRDGQQSSTRRLRQTRYAQVR